MKKTMLAIAATFAAATTALAANYTISNLGELQTFMQNAHNPPYYEGDTVTLEADIDCEGGQFTSGYSPVGTVFKGTFDGQGHKIYNFFNKGNAAGTGQESNYGVAMFDIARDGAVIKNLTLEGSFDDGAALPDYAAAFVAYAIGHTNGTLGLTLENCHFIGSVTNYKCSAAFVGCAVHGSGAPDGKVLRMKNCTARGTVRSDYSYVVGGLVADGEAVEAEDCSFEGNATCRWTLGGLIGKAVDSSFKRCSFKGALGSGLNILGGKDGGCGGLVGFASNSVFRACSSDADIEWNIDTDPYDPDGRINSYNFTADGGAAGVTCGSSAFYDCTAAGTLLAKHGYAGGFVGWTAGAEIFSNCTTSVTLQPDARYSNTHGHGGFASTVASSGALFVDCSTSSQGHNIVGGFFNNQHPRKGVLVGRNTFRRCHVENVPAESAGFCSGAWNCTFEGCTVRGGTGSAGFVYTAGQRPSGDYSWAQTSTFTDCSVVGTRVAVGFVGTSNEQGAADSVNEFRRCRAGCIYDKTMPYVIGSAGFVADFYRGSLAEDCAAYGIEARDQSHYGFADSISGQDVVVRRCVAAGYPVMTDPYCAGFAATISYYTTVEDCYSVYGPRIETSGLQGGFVEEANVGYNSIGNPITRCFALGLIPAGSVQGGRAGAFAGKAYNTSYENFVDCYRPEESPAPDVGNIGDDAGVGALSLAAFATATAATMPNYDFANVWHAPAAVGASSPYLDASVDENTNFWFFATVIGAEGKILINGEAPKEAYPAGAVLTVEAIADNPEMPFAGWIGDGFANPASRVTTYTVKNVGAIGARFCTPIYTVDDWTNRVHATYISQDTTAYALMNDLDFTDYIASNGLNYISGYYSFSGKLFGQGHTIKGLDWTEVNVQSCGSLFNALSAGAEIRDLTVVSTVTAKTGRMGNAAGLVASVGSGVLITNCHAVVDYKGVYSQWADNNAQRTCEYYGLVADASGANIRIVDCTVEGRLEGMTRACGFVGSASLVGGEIARCAVYVEVDARTNRTDGTAGGFAGSLYLDGGAVVRECFSAGIVDSAGFASGFADDIQISDGVSAVRDCYSTAEVIGGDGGWSRQGAAGFARQVGDSNSEGGIRLANCWFGGTARTRGEQDEYNKPYGFVYYISGDVTLDHCAFVKSDEVAMSGTAGVTAIDKDARLSAASWAGYDIGGKWTMVADRTTPYFAWSVSGRDGAVPGGFRMFAFDEEPGTKISCPDAAEPGSQASVAADAEVAKVLDKWVAAPNYANDAAAETTFLADNHRTVRCTWKDADPPVPGATQSVTFDGNEGLPASQNAVFDQGGAYSPLPVATRDDYLFLGWSPVKDGGAMITTNTMVTAAAARTFYAQWQAVVYDPIPDGWVVLNGYTGTYDGRGHGIDFSVVDSVDGISFQFAGSAAAAAAPPDAWSDAMPMITNVGSMKVWCRISKQGYRSRTDSALVKIDPKPLADGMFSFPEFSETNAVYNGAEQRPEVKAEDAAPCVITSNDWTVVYSDNVNVGTATATFTGKGNYIGTATAQFGIDKRPVTLTSADGTWTYDGDAHSNTTVVAENFALGEGVATNGFATITDAGSTPNTFEYTFNEGTLAANYEVSVEYGTLTVNKKTIENEPGSGSVPEQGLSKFDTEFTYDGLGHTIDTNALVEAFNAVVIGGGTFEYALDDGSGAALEPWAADAAAFTNAGEYVVWYRVTNPNYNDFVHSAKVKINPKPIGDGMFTLLVEPPMPYTGMPQEPEIVAEDVAPCVITADDYDVSYSNNVDVGTATATVTGKGNYTGVKEFNFVISQCEIALDMITVSPRQIAHDGAPHEPEVTVALGDFVAVAGRDYEVSYSNNVEIGPATATVTGKGNFTGSVDAPFEIVKSHFHVEFNANGGTVETNAMDFAFGGSYGELPIPFRSGFVFGGWFRDADFSGTPITGDMAVIAEDLTFYAKWNRRLLWHQDADYHAEGASTWDGYILDAGDAVAGTIQVKTGKPNKKTGKVKLTVTVQIRGEKKASMKTETADGNAHGTVGGRALDLVFKESSFAGTLGGWMIEGSRNVFTAKDAESKSAAAAALKNWQGVYVIAWPSGAQGASPYQTLSVTVAAKGKVKVTGMLADGVKVSAKSQLLVGETDCAVAVSWAKKSSSVACILWLGADGTLECANMPGGGSALVAESRASLVDGAAFRIDPAAVAAAIPGAQVDLLPDGLAVRMGGGKFVLDAAGKVKLLKDKSGIDPAGLGTNPSALKLTYKAKDGSFKGSFSVYTFAAGKLKKTKVDVTGVVLDGRGYGTASVKKTASWPITIE